MTRKVCIVIPVFNEATVIVDNLKVILACVSAITNVRFDVLIVDDGSSDHLKECLSARFSLAEDIHYLKLNRNYGKEAAILAGLKLAVDHDATIVMDSDLEHPPALLHDMVSLWQGGAQVVEACKTSRGSESQAKSVSAGLFYKLFNMASGINLTDKSDFKLLDREVVRFYCALPEKERFFRGLVDWMHFNTAQVHFDVPDTSKTQSSWSTWKLLKYGFNSITAFSALPMQLVTAFGVFTFLLSIVVGAKALYDKFSGVALDGFTTVILLMLIIGSVLMFSLGLIGVYLARIYEEVKQRPLYVVDSRESQQSLGKDS